MTGSPPCLAVKGSPLKMVEALALSRLTFRSMRQNLFWAFFYNPAAIPLAALGNPHHRGRRHGDLQFSVWSPTVCASSAFGRRRAMRARVALLLLLIGAAQSRAEDLTFGVDLRASGWQTVSFPKIAPVVFSARAGTLEVAADSAAGLLWHALTAPRRAPATAQWSWKVEQGVRSTDLTRRGEDDRTLAVYFVFGAAEDAAKGPMALLSASTVTCLVYVFGGSGPRSSLLPSPHMGERGKFIILRPADGPKRQWQQESVDLKADYVRAFRQLPSHLLAVAVSSDSDDTRGRTRAQLRGLRIDG